MKQNDWIVANINNPEFTNSDFKNISGLNLENTQFLTKDEYKKSKFITDNPRFKNPNTGTFDDKLFDQFYDYQAQKFDEFVEDDSIYQREYNFWDIRANDESKIKNPNFQFVNIPNPDRVSFGIYGRSMSGPRKLSKLELAQTQPIYDFEKGKFTDKTPNDYALFRNPFNYIKKLGTSLVLATYEEDGYHDDPITGMKVPHYKGQPILNENGTYYAETLSGRSPRGKQFITNKDLITVDGSTINKYDFFDSDDIKKDPWKVVEDTIASIAPMIFLGPYAWIYSGLIIAKELAKAAPMLVEFSTWKDSDSPVVNNIAGLGHSWSKGTSEFARDHMFSFENFGTLVADVALQWGQQKTIAKWISKLKLKDANLMENMMKTSQAEYTAKYLEAAKNVKTAKDISEFTRTYGGMNLNALIGEGKWTETVAGRAIINKYKPLLESQIQKSTKLGQDLALAYMAIISNTDVYDTAIQHGATNKEAALIALASTGAMFGVDKYFHLGEMFYDDQVAQLRRELNKVLGDAANDVIDGLKAAGGSVGPNGIRKPIEKIITSMNNKVLKALPKFVEKAGDRSLGFFGKAFGEGLEEVTEEFTTDITKTLFEIAGDHGLISTNELGSWENAGPRYLMNFLGGFMGGGIFYGVDAYQNSRTYSEEINEDKLLYLISKDKTGEILKQLDKKFKQKNSIFGSYDLSYDVDKNDHYVTADENHKSQAEVVYNHIKNSVIELDQIMHNHNLKASEDQLYNRLVLSESNLIGLKALLGDMSYFTYYQQDFQSLVNDITSLQKQINTIVVDNPDQELQNRINQLQQQLDAKLLIKDEFISGKRSLDYLSKLLWLVDINASSPFVTLTKDQYSVKRFGRLYDDLLEPEKKIVDQSYNSTRVREDVDKAWNEYKGIRDRISGAFEELQIDDVNQLVKYLEREQNFFDKTKGVFDFNSEEFALNYKQYFTKKLPEYKGTYGTFEEETDEQFTARTAPKSEEETDEQYNQRFLGNHVVALIKQDQLNKLNEFLKQLKGTFIDNATRRKLTLLIDSRVNDIAGESLDLFFKSYDYSGGDDFIDSGKKQIQRNIFRKFIYDYIPNKIKFNKDLIETSEVFGKKVDLELYNEIKAFVQSEFRSNRDTILGKYDLYSLTDADPDESLEEVLDDPNVPEEIKKDIDVFLKNNAVKLNKAEGVLTIQDLIDALFEQEVNGSVNDSFDFEGERQGMIDDLYDIISAIHKNSILQILNQIDRAVNLEKNPNPAIKILEEVATKLDLKEQYDSIEKVLETIYDLYRDSKNVEQFELTDEQIEALNTAKKLLEIARAVVYSATVEESSDSPIGQNKQINRIIKKKSDLFSDVNPLLELDENVGNALYYEIDRYLDEIDRWISKSESNKANLIKWINRCNESLNHTILDFFNVLKNVDGLKLVDEEIDLTDNSIKNVVEVASEIKKNFENYIQERINNGETREEAIVNTFKNLITSLNLNSDLLAKQDITKLDENLDYKYLSDYDKLIFSVAFLLGDFKQFHVDTRKYIKDIDKAPLFTQLFEEYLIDTYFNNVSDINNIFNIVSQDFVIPPYYNTAIITGGGGTGKTSVVAKRFIDKSSNIAVAGPSESQTENLINLSGKGKIKEGFIFNDINSLLKHFFTEEFLKDAEGIIDSMEGDDKYFVKFTNPLSKDSTKGLRIKDTEGIKSVFKSLSKDDIPDLLIIDEATYLAHPYAQLLGLAAKEQGFKILLIGDEAQNNYRLGLDREVGFAFRTPRLDLSLRVANVNMYQNQKQLNKIINDRVLPNNSSDDEIKKDLAAVRFKYFLSDSDFSGTLITDKIENDIISSISKQLKDSDEKVIYVGNPNSQNFIALKQKLGDKVINLSEKQVQGQEAKYVIADVTWKPLMDDDTQVYPYILRLNTLLTRAKKGIIFIDNGLSDGISKSKISNANVEIKLLNLDQSNIIKEQYLQNTDFLNEIKSEEETTSEESPKQSSEITEEELERSFDGTTPNEAEYEEKNKEAEKPIINTSQEQVSIRTYSNISTLGVKRVKLPTNYGQKYTKYEWIYDPSESKRDIGIFLTKTTSDGKVKRALVKQFIQFKNFLICYYHETTDDGKKEYINRLNNSLRKKYFNTVNVDEIFKILEEGKFYVEAKPLDKENGRDSFIGLTTASFEESTDDEVKSTIKINNKQYFVRNYLTLNIGGESIEITLGTVAHPTTWRSNAGDIARAISNKTGEDYDSVVKKITDEYIPAYEDDLRELVAEGGVREINRIQYGEDTEKYSLPNPISLSAFFDGEFDEFEARTCASIVSPAYIITQEQLPGLTKEQSHKYLGRAVVYWTHDPTYKPNELARAYANQPAGSHKIRMQVLYNRGVDFESLLSKKWLEKFKDKSGHDTFPFVLRILGGRMYRCIWNFRARLKNFVESYNDFLDANSFNNDDVIEVLKVQAKIYEDSQAAVQEKIDKAKQNKSGAELNNELQQIFAENTKIVESETEKQLGDKYKIWQAIQEFNKTSKNKEFRIGQDHLNKGMNVGKLFDPKEELGLGKDPKGIFINPNLAKYYVGALDALFNEVLNKIIEESESVNPLDEITLDDTKLDLNKIWGKKESELFIVDEKGNKYNLPVSKEANTMSMIPLVLKEILQRLDVYRNNPSDFETKFNDNKYKIKIRNKSSKAESEIDVLNLFKNLFKIQGTTDSSTGTPELGIISMMNQDDISAKLVDQRITNLFRVMFHGMLSMNTDKDFTRGEPRASVADFKYGICIDPSIQVGRSDVKNYEPALSSTDRSFYLIPTIFGSPIGYFSMQKKTKEQQTNPEQNQVQPVVTTAVEDLSLQAAQQYLNQVNLSIKGRDINRINQVIKNKILKETYFTEDNWDKNPFKFNNDGSVILLSNIISDIKTFLSYEPGILSYVSNDGNSYKVDLNTYFETGEIIKQEIMQVSTDIANQIALQAEAKTAELKDKYQKLKEQIQNNNSIKERDRSKFQALVDPNNNLATILVGLNEVIGTLKVKYPEIKEQLSNLRDEIDKFVKDLGKAENC